MYYFLVLLLFRQWVTMYLLKRNLFKRCILSMICMVKLKQICLDYLYLISLLTFQFFTAVYLRLFKKCLGRFYSNFIYCSGTITDKGQKLWKFANIKWILQIQAERSLRSQQTLIIMNPQIFIHQWNNHEINGITGQNLPSEKLVVEILLNPIS